MKSSGYLVALFCSGLLLLRAELEEEEQSMERLRRWHRELALRDIFGAPSAPGADRRLKDCEAKLDDYTERVFNALHAT